MFVVWPFRPPRKTLSTKFFASSFAVAIFLSAAPSLVEARSNRQGHIPNGGAFSCDSCHGLQSLEPEHLTPFGQDVLQNMDAGVVQWENIWMLDSDSDGYSNGLELNDPNGQWRRGQPNPVGPISNPGIPNVGICGDGVLEGEEICEGNELIQCGELGLGSGEVECKDCKWDTWYCGTCGDGIINPEKEECDGSSFGERTCADYNFRSGELTCSDRCRIETTECGDEAPAVCGDGVLSRGEQCDGDLFGEVDCARLNFLGGDLLCTADCKWNVERCIERDYDSPDMGSEVGGDMGSPESPEEPEGDSSSGCTHTGGQASWWWLLVFVFARNVRATRGRNGRGH